MTLFAAERIDMGGMAEDGTSRFELNLFYRVALLAGILDTKGGLTVVAGTA